MSILYDESQQAIVDETRRVLAARTDTARLLTLLERTGEYDQGFWQTAIAQGWTGMALPEAYGGLGLGLIELGIVAQASGTHTAGAPFLTTNDAAACALLGGGDEALKARWLPQLAAGTAIGSFAFAEGSTILPGSPGVAFADGALTGIKHGVTAGLQADFAVVWAMASGGPVLAVADLGDTTRTAIDSFDNSRGFADIGFAGTPAAVIADGKAAHALARDVLARVAVVTAHEQLGGAEALLLRARDYALDRKAFGQPIGAFQSIKHRLAELYGLVEIARANCIDAAAQAGQPGFLKAAAAARISATEAYDTAARDAMQVHGGIGVTWDLGLHLHMRRARSLAIEAGNILYWEDLLAAELLGGAA